MHSDTRPVNPNSNDVLTSEPCEGALVNWGNGKPPRGERNGRCTTIAEHAAVRCCRDHLERPQSAAAVIDYTASRVKHSEYGSCVPSATYTEAYGHCKSHDLRLCSADEIQGGAAQDTGCGFDSKEVWTKCDSSSCNYKKLGFFITMTPTLW